MRTGTGCTTLWPGGAVSPMEIVYTTGLSMKMAMESATAGGLDGANAIMVEAGCIAAGTVADEEGDEEAIYLVDINYHEGKGLSYLGGKLGLRQNTPEYDPLTKITFMSCNVCIWIGNTICQ